jgi:hypothetical protein
VTLPPMMPVFPKPPPIDSKVTRKRAAEAEASRVARIEQGRLNPDSNGRTDPQAGEAAEVLPLAEDLRPEASEAG